MERASQAGPSRLPPALAVLLALAVGWAAFAAYVEAGRALASREPRLYVLSSFARLLYHLLPASIIAAVAVAADTPRQNKLAGTPHENQSAGTPRQNRSAGTPRSDRSVG
jgi:hypothetical protein